MKLLLAARRSSETLMQPDKQSSCECRQCLTNRTSNFALVQPFRRIERTPSFLRLLVHVVDHDYRNRPFLLHQLESELFFHCFKDRDAIGGGSFGSGV